MTVAQFCSGEECALWRRGVGNWSGGGQKPSASGGKSQPSSSVKIKIYVSIVFTVWHKKATT